jgi:hypothetical protein
MYIKVGFLIPQVFHSCCVDVVSPYSMNLDNSTDFKQTIKDSCCVSWTSFICWESKVKMLREIGLCMCWYILCKFTITSYMAA